MEKWVEEIFPGIYKIGNDASDTGGNQAILIEKIQSFLKDHHRKRERAKKQVDKFLK